MSATYPNTRMGTNAQCEDGRRQASTCMPTKKKNRPYGTQQVPGVPIVQAYRNRLPLPKGTPYSWSYGPYFPINRRIGTKSDIRYQTGNDGSFRPCEHDTESYLPVPVWDRVTCWDDSSQNVNVYPGVVVSGLQKYGHQRNYSQFTYAVASVTSPLATVQWSALAQTALANILPSFGGKNSLLNFLYELKDFKKLFLSLTTRFISKSDVIRKVLGFEWYDKPLQKCSKTYLSYQFGWRPLYNDLVQLYESLSGFNALYKRFKDEANTDLQRHFSTLISGTAVSSSLYYDSGDQNVPFNTGTTSFKTRSRVAMGPCEGIRYNATVRYRYPFPPELASAGGKAKAFLDTLGISGNPAILWNAIPFSFLIDWVVNVGGWLDKLRIDNIRFQTEIRDFCHSAVITRGVEYQCRYTSSGYAGPTNLQTINWSEFQITDTCMKRYYIRKKGIPDFLSAMQTSGLNLREFSLAGALAGSRGRR